MKGRERLGFMNPTGQRAGHCSLCRIPVATPREASHSTDLRLGSWDLPGLLAPLPLPATWGRGSPAESSQEPLKVCTRWVSLGSGGWGGGGSGWKWELEVSQRELSADGFVISNKTCVFRFVNQSRLSHSLNAGFIGGEKAPRSHSRACLFGCGHSQDLRRVWAF